MSDWKTTVALGLGCLVLLHIGRQALTSKTSRHLPPGPPGLPWIGNVIGIDTSAPWRTYAQWAKKYGDIIHSRLLGKDIVIINSVQVAKDLLEKRSSNYSDRPYIITADLCGVGFNSGAAPYGDRWRLHRRFFHQTFRLDAIPRFLPLQHRKSCQLLRRLFESPEELSDHVNEYTASVILNSTYDYDPVSREEELFGIVLKVMEVVVPAVRPDAAIVIGAFPFLLYLPSWLPGMGFKRKMASARVYAKQYLEQPFEYSLQRVSAGSIASSMVHDALRTVEETGIAPEGSWMQALKEASGTAFLAASETTHSVLMTFFFMMVLNPEVQDKAHAQIDTIVGRTRLPTMEDRPSLPLLDAIFWETLRYSPVGPLGAPHAAVDDDVYAGLHIPKGALILANIWSMAHNESKYPNPHVFMPERFLNDDGSLKPDDIANITFGFGRRICVGRHFADSSIWGVIAKVLAVFKILRPLDEHGLEVLVEEGFSSGVMVHPLPFKCRFVPRFAGMNAKELDALISASAP